MRIHVESLPLPHSLRRATITRNIPHQARYLYLVSISYAVLKSLTHSYEPYPWIKMTSAAPTTSPSYYTFPLSPPPKSRPTTTPGRPRAACLPLPLHHSRKHFYPAPTKPPAQNAPTSLERERKDQTPTCHCPPHPFPLPFPSLSLLFFLPSKSPSKLS